MPDLSSTPTEIGTPSLSQGGAATVWNQPGFASLWGLATAKDSLKFWLKTKSFHTAALARWLFTILFITITLNGFVVLNRIITGGQKADLPTWPYTTFFVLLVVLAFTKERSRGVYIWSAWIFWIFFTLIGFVNPSGVTMENFRLVIQSVGKTWIGLIAMPWMAFRVISPDQLPRYTKLLVYTSAVGSILCFGQLWYPALFSYVRVEKLERAGGTWINANVAGMVLMQSLLLSPLGSWQKNWVKWMVYLIILAGLIATFSRGALFSYVAGLAVYLIMVKSYKRIFLGGTFLLLFLASGITIGLMVENKTINIESKEIRDRAQIFSKMFSDKANEEITGGRMYLWKAGVQDVLDGGSLLFGLGHAGMLKSKTVGLAPHNDYIQHFADGGLLGLGAFLGFLGVIAYVIVRCKDLTIRACLMSMLVAHVFFCMSADKNFLQQPFGPFIALMVLWAHYSRDYPGVEKVQRLKLALSRKLALAQASGPTAVEVNPS